MKLLLLLLYNIIYGQDQSDQRLNNFFTLNTTNKWQSEKRCSFINNSVFYDYEVRSCLETGTYLFEQIIIDGITHVQKFLASCWVLCLQKIVFLSTVWDLDINEKLFSLLRLLLSLLARFFYERGLTEKTRSCFIGWTRQLDYRIPVHLFACEWICLVLQRMPHVC